MKTKLGDALAAIAMIADELVTDFEVAKRLERAYLDAIEIQRQRIIIENLPPGSPMDASAAALRSDYHAIELKAQEDYLRLCESRVALSKLDPPRRAVVPELTPAEWLRNVKHGIDQLIKFFGQDGRVTAPYDTDRKEIRLAIRAVHDAWRDADAHASDADLANDLIPHAEACAMFSDTRGMTAKEQSAYMERIRELAGDALHHEKRGNEFWYYRPHLQRIVIVPLRPADE